MAKLAITIPDRWKLHLHHVNRRLSKDHEAASAYVRAADECAELPPRQHGFDGLQGVYRRSGYYDDSRDANDVNSLSRLNTVESISQDSFEASIDARTPGVFTIPVCFSEHSWSTVVDGHYPPHKLMHNLDARNSIKAVPCNCGPWGIDREQFWQEVGFGGDDLGRSKTIARKNCGNHIGYKIKDPLEKFVALCRMDLRRTPSKMPNAIDSGKHPSCDTITSLIDQSGLTLEKLKSGRPESYVAIQCFAGIFKDKHHKDVCERYKAMDLGSLLRVVGEEEVSRRLPKNLTPPASEWVLLWTLRKGKSDSAHGYGLVT
ncbi:hypothetical protein BZA05DRAFT_439491 [Tricharina praecox]|uniref:uncharacterized protein n=1 Tax=Tricharina praecox TaxID=43433 RepID=UPI00221F9F55|nr:uncharacterized protein BZA05DRAFT_439491 [Tricharina praecox]KAI5842730.1 hypothetical protein BZA05DRAFT_439491 [Tricharina praecox]